MGEHTHISWCDHTFNPWIGCTKIAPACDGCYAAHLMDTRLGRVKWDGPPVRTSAGNWHQPVKWNRAAFRRWQAVAHAGEAYRPPFVFCSSLADVFDNQADPVWRADLFDLIDSTPFLTWLLLTKRPQNILKMVEAAGGLTGNAAIGTTCEDQKHADINLPHLLKAKAALEPAFAFMSGEPLLGPLDIRWALSRNRLDISIGFQARGHFSPGLETVSGLDWVITGGETDQGAHKARPTHPQWFRDIRDQCAAARVPYHHKQNGEWVSVSEVAGQAPAFFTFPDGSSVRRLGKRKTGRTIDGVEHNGFPELRA